MIHESGENFGIPGSFLDAVADDGLAPAAKRRGVLSANEPAMIREGEIVIPSWTSVDFVFGAIFVEVDATRKAVGIYGIFE